MLANNALEYVVLVLIWAITTTRRKSKKIPIYGKRTAPAILTKGLKRFDPPSP